MQDGSFVASRSATNMVVGGRVPVVLILIGILGLIEAGCGPPR
jgi:hypothetical protein